METISFQSIFEVICNNFSFSFMITVNILTYIIISIIDTFNGDKAVSFWQKRLILFISIIFLTTLYATFDDISASCLINSAIAAPVFWSWIVKPIITHTQFDYKKIDDTLN